jgi:hypothetical protein
LASHTRHTGPHWGWPSLRRARGSCYRPSSTSPSLLQAVARSAYPMCSPRYPSYTRDFITVCLIR